MNRVATAKTLLMKTFANWSQDNVPRLAAAFSFYAVLSIAPVLVLAVTVASIILTNVNVQEQLFRTVKDFAGGSESVVQLLKDLIKNAQKGGTGTIATIISFLVTFFSASNLFLQLQDTVNTIWGIQQRGPMIKQFITTRILAFVAVAVFGALMIAWLGLDSWLSWVARHTPGFDIGPLLSLVGAAAFFTLALGIAYKGMPKGRVAWRDVWPGAGIAATGIALSKLAFSAYFAYANVAAAYGAAGSLVVLLLWIYYTSQIFFFGLEVTYTYAKEFGSLKGRNPGDLQYS